MLQELSACRVDDRSPAVGIPAAPSRPGHQGTTELGRQIVPDGFSRMMNFCAILITREY